MFYDKTYEEPWNAFFFRAENGCVQCAFFWSRNFIQPIFPAIRETDLCSVSKRNLFWVYFYRKVFLFRSDSEDSFRVRSSSICLDLRLDMPIILFTIFG